MAHPRSIAAGSRQTWSAHRGKAANGQRHIVGSAHRRAVARHARDIWPLELGFLALHPLEQAWRLGCGIQGADESWAFRQRGARRRFHDFPGAPARRRRKRGTQNQEELGRSRNGFSTKIDLLTNTQEYPLRLQVTGSEVLITDEI
jgi:hypothetical protein